MYDLKNINFDKSLVMEHGDDKIFVAEAVRHNSRFFLYANEILKSDYQFVLFLIEQSESGHGGSIDKEHVGDNLRDDENFIRDVIKLLGTYGLSYASDRLKKDRDFIQYLIKQDPKFFEYIDASLKTDIPILISIGGLKTTQSMIDFINSEVESEKYDMSDGNSLLFRFCNVDGIKFDFYLQSGGKYAYSTLLKEDTIIKDESYRHNGEDNDIWDIHGSFIYSYDIISLRISDFGNEFDEDTHLVFMYLDYHEKNHYHHLIKYATDF